MPYRRLSIIVLVLALILQPLLVSASVAYQYGEFKELIGRQAGTKRMIKTKRPSVGIISHHLPTASPLIDNFYGQLKVARPDIKTFVIVGPDHFERCRQKFSTTDAPIETMYGPLSVDRQLFAKLVKSGAKKEEGCFHGEHSIGVEANYIKKFFPGAKVVPLLLSYSARKLDFAKTIQVLKQERDNVFVVASMDFVHYVDARQSAAIDEVSRKMITENKGDSFSLKQVDSPAAIKLVLRLAQSMKLKAEIVNRKNSFDYDGTYKNTTSYFSVFF